MDVEVNSKLDSKSFISEDDLKHLRLNNVQLTGRVLGQGSYGTVYKAEYHGTVCAVKKVDLSKVKSALVQRVKENFLLECLQHSKLSHPNIVKMLGVFYPRKETILPVLVMELMEYNLTQLLKRSHNIPMYVKLSILQDVSRGLCYLHAQNPPIVHQALYSDNILFTKDLTAKLGDFKTGADTVFDQALLSIRRNRNSNNFLPDSCNFLKYDLSLNVFSFGCIICHVIIQKWPVDFFEYLPVSRLSFPATVTFQSSNDDIVKLTVNDWDVEKHHRYISEIKDNSLKRLVEACLQHNQNYRPHMSQIFERITSIITGKQELMYNVFIGL